METEGAEVMHPYELSYSDLLLLSSSKEEEEENEKLEGMRRSIMENLGPKGAGLLSVTAVPDSSLLRQNLLPLARTLALLNPDHRKDILKEHNLGSDVPLKNPDRKVSSFAMQLEYSQVLESTQSKISDNSVHYISPHLNHLDVDRESRLVDNEFQNLGNAFKELGFCMMKIGLCLARVCDKAIGGQELEHSLLESGSAKGRLIHYHSLLDSIVLKDAGRKGSAKGPVNHKTSQDHSIRSGQKQSTGSKSVTSDNEGRSCGIHSNLWQQWHYDYGVFTVLTDPMFLLPSYSPERVAEDQLSISGDRECPPNGHSYLQNFNPSKNKIFMVKTAPESFIVQVGESADILSKGQLRSTLHCVSRPKLENLSRETYVVFLQPAWTKTFSISDHTKGYGPSNQENGLAEKDENKLSQEIKKIVPPLSSRLKDGMTFAEFSRETTKQYYGGSGLQSNRKVTP